MTDRIREGLAPAYLLLCLVLGGASAAGLWANMLLQLLAIPIILWSLVGSPDSSLSPPARRLILLAGLAVALVALQLVPLPPALWSLLPGRQAIVEGYQMLGMPLPWLPISLAPYDTVASALWLLPALAVLIGMLRLGFNRDWLAWSVVIVAALSLPLGLVQVTAGSLFYIYEISDFGLYTGLFANAGHLALLLLVALPLLVALYVGSARRGRGEKTIDRQTLILLTALLAIAAGLILSASLTALGLALPVAIACLCIWLRRKRRISRLWALPIGLLALLYIGVVSFTSFQNSSIWNEAIGGPDSRHPALGKSIAAALDFQPMGSGIGTFPDIYRRYEDADSVGRVYLNHAHNDYVELLLETGLPGLALIIAFLLWWGRRTHAIWLSNESGPLQRAATIASGTILVHSAVGYPLRTAALAAVFAACCALMARPREKNVSQRGPGSQPAKYGRTARHLSAN
ncbi:O-antigen ligase family protein [Sphingosinicella humi]|nr:O-antigen ligase family protein [Sphingosinicella humi]